MVHLKGLLDTPTASFLASARQAMKADPTGLGTCNPDNFFYTFSFSSDGINFIDECQSISPHCSYEFDPLLSGRTTVFVKIKVNTLSPSETVATLFEWFETPCPFVSIRNRGSNLDTSIKTIQISPNPIADRLKIDMNFNIEPTMLMEIYNLEGKISSSEKCSDIACESNSICSNVSNLPSGIYLVKILTSEKSLIASSKFVKL